MDVELYRQHGFHTPMFCRLYIEALLVDEEMADLVWEAWDARIVSDELACIAWWFVATSGAAERLASNRVVLT